MNFLKFQLHIVFTELNDLIKIIEFNFRYWMEFQELVNLPVKNKLKYFTQIFLKKCYPVKIICFA